MSDALPPSLTAVFPPDADALLAACCELITDDMLTEISRADCGIDVSENYEAVKKIRQSGRVPTPMTWPPLEVLSLMRCDLEERSERKFGPALERAHIMRAFCCAALLRAEAEPANEGREFHNDSGLIRLIDSALFLGRGLPEAAARYLMWHIPLVPDYWEERPLYMFGLIAIALLTRREAFSLADIDELVSFFERADAVVRAEGNYTVGPLADHELFVHLHKPWYALAARLRAHVPDSDRVAAMTQRFATSEEQSRKQLESGPYGEMIKRFEKSEEHRRKKYESGQ